MMEWRPLATVFLIQQGSSLAMIVSIERLESAHKLREGDSLHAQLAAQLFGEVTYGFISRFQ